MRRTAAEKYEFIRLVEGSDLPVRQTLRELCLNRSTFYRWHRRFLQRGRAGLESQPAAARRYWNRIPPRVRQRVVDAALADPERSPRELAWQLTDRGGPFSLRIERLSHPQGVRPHSESGLRRALSGEDVPASDASAQRALADRLHLLAGGQLGLVLPVGLEFRIRSLNRGLGHHCVAPEF